MLENKNSKRAVIYCRVSTREQAEEGNSLVSQERICREYAIKNGYEIVHAFIEQGESAKTADRTELQNLFRYCAERKNAVQAVISYKIDRISRNTDSYSEIRILLKRYGVEIKSTSEYFENTPAGKFMENMIANVAQFDNDVRTERSVNGMKDAMREGRYVWFPPVGYMTQKNNGKVNIVHTEMAPFIKKAFEEIAQGCNTVEEVWRKVTALGLQSKTGKPVARSHFYLLLKNELYSGFINRFGERHKGIFEPIISEELFNRVQRVLKRKKRVDPYLMENPDFPLRRFITSQYGDKLTGAWSQGRRKKYAYYRFIKTRQQWPKEVFEDMFNSFINNFSLNERLYKALKHCIKEELVKKTERNQNYVIELLEQERIVKEKRQILVEKNLTGIISDSLVKEHLEIIEDELWKIRELIDTKACNRVDFSMILDSLYEFLMQPAETLKKLPFLLRVKLLWFKFPKGVIYDGIEFRTAEIRSLFKLKNYFLNQDSSLVHKSNFKTNTQFYTKTSAVNRKIEKGFWEQVGKDLVELEELLNEKSKEDLHPAQLAHFDPLKKVV